MKLIRVHHEHPPPDEAAMRRVDWEDAVRLYGEARAALAEAVELLNGAMDQKASSDDNFDARVEAFLISLRSARGFLTARAWLAER